MKSLVTAVATLLLVSLALYTLLPPPAADDAITTIPLKLPAAPAQPPTAVVNADAPSGTQTPLEDAGTDNTDADLAAIDASGDEPVPATDDASEPAEAGEAEPADWVEYEVKPGDTMARVFASLDLGADVLARVLASGPEAKRLADLRPGQLLRIRRDENGDLADLVHERSSVETLRVEAGDDGFAVAVDEKPVEVRTHAASTSIDSSLFVDGQNAGLSDQVIMQVAELFNWDIDFVRELRQGDRFSLIYEAKYVDGEKYRDGDILAAEFVNGDKTYRAIRYRDPGGNVDYYSPDGRSKKKAFIKTPVKFSRISSRFTNKRWHPVLKRWRSHKGVDYAAPTGTPVKAAGKGRIDFIGRQRGYGKVIILQHGDRYTTVYGHLSSFAKGLRKGDTVKQGQVIGRVGQTGLATGPHLHYEFRVNGKHIDPLSHKLPTAMPLPKQYMADFRNHAEPLVEQLNMLAAPRIAEKN